MALSTSPDRCAVLVNDGMGRPTVRCSKPPTHQGTWRFFDHTARILLCDGHAEWYADDARLANVKPIT